MSSSYDTLKVQNAKLTEALREARRALDAAEHDDGRAMFPEGSSLRQQIDAALAG